MSGDLPNILRTHAQSMWTEGFYTVAIALERAAEHIQELLRWRARESETQEALQAIGEEFGVRGGEPRVDGIRRVLTEQRDQIAALLREAGDGWMSIESAPHNVPVLLAWRSGGLEAWSFEAGVASHGARYPNGASSMSFHGQATHWRPLPPAPEKNHD